MRSAAGLGLGLLLLLGSFVPGTAPALLSAPASPEPGKDCKASNGCPVSMSFRYPGTTRCFAKQWEAPQCDFGPTKDAAHPACTFPCQPQPRAVGQVQHTARPPRTSGGLALMGVRMRCRARGAGSEVAVRERVKHAR